MKRDMDLVRKLLFFLEAVDEPGGPSLNEQEYFSGFPEEKLAEHRYLVWKAGLARGSDGTTNVGYDGLLDGLTWEGHDFVEAARNDTMWNNAKAKVKEAGVGATVDVMKQVLKTLAMQAINAVM